MRLERRETQSRLMMLTAPLVAILVALMLAGGLIALSGASVPEAFRRIAVGAFGSRLAITETLTRATPLIFTGLAVAVAFRARVWNIGAEGQLYLGAVAAVAVGATNPLGLPPLLLVPVVALAGAAAGAALLLVPVALRIRFAVDEVVTTLLLNFVVLLFVSMMIEGPMKDPLAFGWPASVPVVDAATLPGLVERSRLHAGLILAVVVACVVQFVMSRTVFGLEARATGHNPAAARFAGVSVGATLLKVAALSGGLAGLAGAVEVMGVKGYVTTDLSPGFGYAGIIVAMLANLSPVGVVAAAVFSAAIFVGADSMGRAMSVPSFIADVTVALALLTMLVALLLTTYRIRR
ncbi:ABC transporter permease [Acuticoccus sp. I52.16.1]|uniref:ABC transporter permease n=1 Tax=Acuticoccus sp. I52.16.1 TaxID=2928472 RepID=UPI001FD2BC27|nr:ABC transporter permease [Acuticoccus sp. I52.16.1]UOM35893.1 ABC transporter permease [Acuticoccus sp. I52.16.1]